jgi:hypothetical protein
MLALRAWEEVEVLAPKINHQQKGINMNQKIICFTR